MYRSGRLFVALLLVAALAACGQGSGPSSGSGETAVSSVAGEAALEELAGQAKEEGQLTIYTVAGEETVNEWVAPFEDKYGIDVQTYRASSGVLWERWQQETRAGQHLADAVIMNDFSQLSQANERDWLAKFTPANDEKFSKGAKRAGKWYVIYRTVEPLAWNTDEVTEEEARQLRSQGLQALTDDRWKGRVGLVAPQATERVLATYYRWVNSDALGWSYVEQVAALNPDVYESAVPLVERLAAGEHHVILGSASSIAGRAVGDGAPIEFSFPGTSTAASFGAAVSANAPHPNAARLFQQWATTEQALSNLSQIAEGLPPHDGVEDQRAAVQKEWYSPPEELDTDWASDQKMQEASQQLLDRWANTFDYLR